MDDRLARMIQRLHTKTIAREVSWDEFGDDEFITHLAGHAVVIVRKRQADGGDDASFLLQIYDPQGAGYEELVPGGCGESTEQELQDKLGEIWRVARRQCLWIDGAVDSIVAELGGGGTDGEPDDDLPF